MVEIEGLLGRRYRDLKAASALGLDMPEPDAIEDQSYVSLVPLGISLVLPDHVHVGAIQLHGEAHEGFAGYAGRLPGDITFAMSRDEVRRKLGPPKKSGERTRVPILGEKPAWDSYAVGTVHLHIEYSMNGAWVQLVSLIPA